MKLPSPDPAALILCQTPGLQPAQALKLIADLGDAEAVLRAPTAALRTAGLPPAVVARVVGGLRQRATVEAGLKGLTRLGIVPVPLVSPEYPQRLREAPAPPLVLYAQGTWPPRLPAVAVQGLPPDDERPATTEWVQDATRLGIALIGSGEVLELLPPAGSIAVVPFGLMLARQRLPATWRQAVQAGTATVVSAVAVNHAADERSAAQAQVVALALADALLLLDPSSEPTAPLPTFLLAATTPPALPRRIKRLRHNQAGLRKLAQTVGLYATGETTVQQERLW